MARKSRSVGGITLPICVPRVARTFLLSLLAIVLLGGHLAEARITKIVIETRTSPAFGGASFGNVGQYEQLTGVAFGEVDPKDPLNAVPVVVVDRDKRLLHLALAVVPWQTRKTTILVARVANFGVRPIDSYFSVYPTATCREDRLIVQPKP